MYNFIYLIADQLVKKYNPCDIQVNRSGFATCGGYYDKPSCCDGCKYLSIKGCTTKALGCKLDFCTKAHIMIKKKYPELIYKMNILKAISQKVNISTKYRIPRELYFHRTHSLAKFK